MTFANMISLPRVSRSALACLLLFVVVSVLVVTGVTSALDRRVLQALASWRTPGLTTFMRGVSWIGNWQGEIPLLFLVAALLWRGHRRTGAWRFLALAASAEMVWAAAKLLFHRPRPTIVLRLGDAGWFSYPSGHATLAPVIWGFGLILLAQLVESRPVRTMLRTLAIGVPALIAVSRLYLGVHYPTDVVAGLALGAAWVLLWHRRVSVPDEIARPP